VSELFRLFGKVAVVIGGTGELCGAMGEGLAGAGASVVLVGRSAQKAERRLGRIAAAGGQGCFLPCDVTRRQELEGLLAEVLRRFARADVLVNGAGVNSARPFLEVQEEEFDQIVAVNFKATFLACQVFGKYFVERSQREGTGASIINVGSISAVRPLSKVFTYAAAKAALHNLSKNLAREWAPFGVRVNVLVPGFFPAEQNRRILTPERVAAITSHTPLGRFGEAGELVGATLLLASDAAGGFITGHELIVDGGFSATSI
jgi:NAD(P)-dependent dehydrogenase (short-subunit alcohol dehydrogenase family)